MPVVTSRLQGGVTPGPDRCVSSPGPLADGAPVVVGPAGADPAPALRTLARLVAAGGPVAAAAGVDLGDGFVSGRIERGAGDRRDAVLAVLALPDFAGRLPDRRTVLTALFGPDATKPLGAAAQAAVDSRRWAALRYAVAVSDLLGPEQLVDILALPDPADGDPFPDGLPSVAGAHLARVLTGIPVRDGSASSPISGPGPAPTSPSAGGSSGWPRRRVAPTGSATSGGAAHSGTTTN